MTPEAKQKRDELASSRRKIMNEYHHFAVGVCAEQHTVIGFDSGYQTAKAEDAEKLRVLEKEIENLRFGLTLNETRAVSAEQSLERLRELEEVNKTIEYLRHDSKITHGHWMKMKERLDVYIKALEFYADKDNWDDDQFKPTIWDDGNIDMGRIARQALGPLNKKEEE